MRSILQLGLMVLLLLGAGNRAWGKVAVGQTIAEQVFVGSDVFVSVVDTPPVLMSAGEAAACGYDLGMQVGPNVYAYVRQNPWTGWDPHGLADEKKQPKKLNFTPANPDSTKTKPQSESVAWNTDITNKKESDPGAKSAKKTQTKQEQELAEIGKHNPKSLKELDGINKAINAERHKGEEMVLEGVLWGVAIAEPGPLGEEMMLSRAAAAKGTTPLYRAVMNSELDDIARMAAFRNPAGIEVKYFSKTAEGAASYGKQAYGKFGDTSPYTIVRTDAPSRLVPTVVPVDGGIPAVVIPTKSLPQLSTPQILPYTPLPR